MADRTADRAASEVLSYALVFSLVLVSIVIVSVLGIAGLEDVRAAEQAQNAETAFDVLDANMAELYYEGAPSRATELDLGESQLVTGPPVTVTVARERASGGWDNDSFETRPVEQRLDEDRRMVYEAGAVFRTSGESGLTVREPPLVSTGENIHLTLPALEGPANRSLGSGTALVRAEVIDREVLVSDTDGTYDTFVITVESPRSDRWHELLEADGFSCSDAGPGTVECRRDSFERLYVTVHEIEVTLVR